MKRLGVAPGKDEKIQDHDSIPIRGMLFFAIPKGQEFLRDCTNYIDFQMKIWYILVNILNVLGMTFVKFAG